MSVYVGYPALSYLSRSVLVTSSTGVRPNERVNRQIKNNETLPIINSPFLINKHTHSVVHIVQLLIMHRTLFTIINATRSQIRYLAFHNCKSILRTVVQSPTARHKYCGFPRVPPLTRHPASATEIYIT